MSNSHPFVRASCVLALALAALSNHPAAATGQLDVAIVASADGSTTDPGFTDPQSKLLGTGFFASVDLIHAGTTTPSLAQLQAYDAVIVWSNSDFLNATALGDVLADYVDGGGGVVLAMFATTDPDPRRRLGGRWVTGGYDVIVSGAGSLASTGSLGTIQLPAHPLMAGVTTFTGGTSMWRPTTTALGPGATLVASWADGKPLVAVHGTRPNRVDLGMYPPSDAVFAGWWHQHTDGDLLMANALAFTANPEVGTPFCFGDGSSAACPCSPVPVPHGAPGRGCPTNVFAGGARVHANGTASLANDTLVLTATDVIDGSLQFYQGPAQQSGGAGITFGDGKRCVAPAGIRRFKTKSVAGHTASYPGVGDARIHAAGAIGAPGTFHYQGWYRSAHPSFCTAETFNMTNGLSIAWTP